MGSDAVWPFCPGWAAILPSETMVVFPKWALTSLNSTSPLVAFTKARNWVLKRTLWALLVTSKSGISVEPTPMSAMPPELQAIIDEAAQPAGAKP